MKRPFFALPVFLVAVVLLTDCHKKEIPPEKVFPVKVEKARPKSISSIIVVAGTVDSKVHTWITSPGEGSVYSLKIAEGSDVRPGEILCYIMPADQQNMLGQAQADFQQAKNKYENAGDDKVVLREQLKEIEARLASAKRLYKPVPVVSPMGGTVISKVIETGNNVAAKQPIIEIADIRRLIIKSAVSEDYVSKIRQGQTVRIKLHSFENENLNGKITVITPGIQMESRTAGIEVSLASDRRIKPGMTASLQIVVERKENALVIPQDSLTVKPNGDRFVFVVENDTARMVKVRSGIESNTEIEITEGLKSGDQVVVLGQENLKDGAKVKMPQPENADKKGSKP